MKTKPLALVPYGFICSDSVFAIRAQIAHASGIAQVRMRGTFRPAQGPIVLDTLAMTETGPEFWESGWDRAPHQRRSSSY